MSAHAIAKTKLKNLTSRTQKKLYKLKYSTNDYMPMTYELYTKILLICSDNDMEFPFRVVRGDIYIKKLAEPKLVSILYRLADDYAIIIDYSLLDYYYSPEV